MPHRGDLLRGEWALWPLPRGWRPQTTHTWVKRGGLPLTHRGRPSRPRALFPALRPNRQLVSGRKPDPDARQ